MLDGIMQIIVGKNPVAGNYDVSQREYLFIKKIFDDAAHIIYAQEKKQTQEGGFAKAKQWKATYALTKKLLMLCIHCLSISYVTKYNEQTLKVVSEPVYIINTMITDLLNKLSYRLNTLYGLANGNELETLMERLRARMEEMEELQEDATVQGQTNREAMPQDPMYHFDD